MNDITLIDESGKLITEITTFEQARRMAQNSGKDLILVNAKSNTYRIADAGKLKYEQKQKERQQRAQRRTHKIKEIQISPNIEMHDLNTKISHVTDFLKKGFKTKITMVLRGRQQAFRDVAFEKLQNLVNDIVNTNLATVDGQIKQEKDIFVYLLPKN